MSSNFQYSHAVLYFVEKKYLIHQGLNKMAAIFKCSYWNIFFIKIYERWLGTMIIVPATRCHAPFMILMNIHISGWHLSGMQVPVFLGGEFLQIVNTLRPRQNGRHFPDDIFKCIFLNENVWISIKSSLKFVPKGPIDNIPALVQIVAWRRPGDKPLYEPMMG